MHRQSLDFPSASRLHVRDTGFASFLHRLPVSCVLRRMHARKHITMRGSTRLPLPSAGHLYSHVNAHPCARLRKRKHHQHPRARASLTPIPWDHVNFPNTKCREIGPLAYRGCSRWSMPRDCPRGGARGAIRNVSSELLLRHHASGQPCNSTSSTDLAVINFPRCCAFLFGRAGGFCRGRERRRWRRR